MPLRLHPDIATTSDNGLVLLDEHTGAYVLHALIDGHHPDHITADLATATASTSIRPPTTSGPSPH